MRRSLSPGWPRVSSGPLLLLRLLVCFFVSSLLSMFWKHLFKGRLKSGSPPGAPGERLPPRDRGPGGCRPWGRAGDSGGARLPHPQPVLGRERLQLRRLWDTRKEPPEQSRNFSPPLSFLPGPCPGAGAGDKVRVDRRSTPRPGRRPASGQEPRGRRSGRRPRDAQTPAASAATGGPRAPAPP